MPSIKMKTHKGIKKRFKVSANGKVSHKRCGSSHLNSHKSGKKIRKLRRKSTVGVHAVARKLKRQLRVSVTTITGPRPTPEADAPASEATQG